MDIFQKLLQIEDETGGDVSNLRRLINSGQLTTASEINRPDPKQSVQEIELFNEFNLRNPRADGGMLVKPSADGSRPGYRQPPSETSQNFINYVKSLDKKVLATKTIDDLIEDSGIDIKKDTASQQLNRNNPDLKYKKRKKGSEDPETQKKIAEISGAKKTKRIETIQKVNNWTNNWFENNAGKYNSYEKAKTQLIKDWKKESKNKIYSGSNFKLSLENGMPNIMAATNESTSATRVADNIFDMIFPIQRPNKELIFRKGYANYRLQNPTFNKKINDYFDLVILDKRGFNTQQELIQSGQLKEGYGLVRTATGDFAKAGSKSMKGKGLLDALNIDREVLDFITTYMKQDGPFFAQRGGENIYDILSKNVDPEKVKNYRNKININVDNWRDNLDAVVKLANKGLPPTKQITSAQLITQMKNESKKMAKLFNLKDLPPELKFFGYSQDHLLGIREALELNDPKIARQTLNTMVGTTRAQNTFLGFKEFGNERRKLITDFNAAPPNARGPIVQKLNDLTKKFIPDQLEYGVRKDGSMKIKVLQPQKSFKARKESYVSEIKKLPKNVQTQFDNLRPLANIGCPNKKADGGRVNFANGQDLVACAIKGAEKLQNTDPKKLDPLAKSNIKTLTKTASGARFLKNILGPGALAFEGLFAAPFAAYDYARGRRGEDIFKSALSLGLLDQKLTDAELKKIFPEYGQAENLQNIGDRLTNLERLQKGTRGQRIRSKPKFEKTTEQFETAAKPFLDTDDPEKAYFENIQKSQDALKELQKQYDERALQRKSQFDLSDPFMAAGGGIAKLAGVDSGPPPESGPNPQGLQGLMKRVKNI